MRDPHVESLLYRLEIDENTSYINPPPVSHDTDAFSLELEDGLLTVRMEQHFPSVELARAEVEKFLRAWELDVALRRGPGELGFVYEDSTVINRDPPPEGEPQAVEGSATLNITASLSGMPHVARTRYPEPPEYFRISPDVETLWQRYQGYKNGNEPLLSMAYFCLTLVQAKAGGRKQAATQSLISEDVLGKLGEISSMRGDGATARKLDPKNSPQPISSAEIAWTEAAMRILIRRVAEARQKSALPLVNMSDLPPLCNLSLTNKDSCDTKSHDEVAPPSMEGTTRVTG